jgi:hypothetical protein
MSKPLSATLRQRSITASGQPADASQDFSIWDVQMPGLGLRNRLGVQSWMVHIRIEDRGTRRSLGAASSLTPEAGRYTASAVRKALKGARVTMTEITAAAFGPHWLSDCTGQWKAGTLIAHRHGMISQILPALGTSPVAALAAEDVGDCFNGPTCAPGGRNRALAVLSGMLPHTGDLLFSDNGKPPPISQLDKFWRGIRAELKRDTRHLHDLRHSYATTAISAGETLRTVGGLLGHSDLATTEGYSRLADDTLRATVTAMRAQDVNETPVIAKTESGCDSTKALHKLCLLTDNGSSYIAAAQLPSSAT